MSVTSTPTPGACSAVPAQTNISAWHPPSSFNATSSIPNTVGGPSQTRLVLTVAVSRSPFCSYDPEYSKKLSPPVIVPSDSVTIAVPSPLGVLNQAEYLPFSSILIVRPRQLQVSS